MYHDDGALRLAGRSAVARFVVQPGRGAGRQRRTSGTARPGDHSTHSSDTLGSCVGLGSVVIVLFAFGVGLATFASGRSMQVLYPLSYVPRDGRTRTRNLLMKDEGTPVCAAGRSRCQDAQQPERHRWLRGHDSNADLLVQSPAWYQFHHLASVWTGGLEPPTPGSRSRCAPVAPRPGGTDGRIRTDTDGGLSAVPLPVGLRQPV